MGADMGRWVHVQDGWMKWVGQDGERPMGQPPLPPVKWEDAEPEEDEDGDSGQGWTAPVGMEDV